MAILHGRVIRHILPLGGAASLVKSTCRGIATTSARGRHVTDPPTSHPTLAFRQPRLSAWSPSRSCSTDASNVRGDDTIHVDALGDVNVTWLRENCRCGNCYSAATWQRSVLVHQLPAESLRVATADCENGRLVVAWQDGHRSEYDLDWLRSVLPPNPVDRTAKVLWDAETVVDAVSPIDFGRLVGDDAAVTELLAALVVYGFALVTDVPANIEATRRAAERVSLVQETFVGQMIEISTDMTSWADTAFTTASLGAHTDTTYLTAPAGLRMLHCQHHDGSGGETLLVDGFHAAEQLRAQHPADFQLLCDTSVYHAYVQHGHNVRSLAPVLTTRPVTGDLIAIRYNHYDRAVFSATEDAGRFLEALSRLSAIVERPTNEFWTKLTPGTMVFMDNWRVLHGRKAYTGFRRMLGCFLPRDDWLNKARARGLL